MTQLEFTSFAQSKVDEFVGRSVYTVAKLAEVEAYMWGLLDCYSATIPSISIEDRRQIEEAILGYVTIEKLPDEDANVYPHGVQLKRLGGN